MYDGVQIRISAYGRVTHSLFPIGNDQLAIPHFHQLPHIATKKSENSPIIPK
jgi:hypothetical protein